MINNSTDRTISHNRLRKRVSRILTAGALVVGVGACGSSDGTASSSTETAAVGPTISDQTSNEDKIATTTVSPVSTTTSLPSVEVTVERGLVYRKPASSDSGTTLSVVDVYFPDGADTRPAVVLLHGYGEFGSSAELTPLTALAEEISQLGATVFNFKWNTAAGWSAASGDDLACMGSFVAARSPEFGSRSDRVVVVGHSMGAEAGINLAFRSFDLPTKGDCTETGSQPNPKAFLGIGGSYGGIGKPVNSDPESYLVTGNCSSEPREVAASDLIKPGLTAQQGFGLGSYGAMDLAPADLRVVLLVGTLDPNRCTRPDITRSFAEALETEGIDNELIEVVGAGHEDVVWPHTDPGENTINIIESILADLEDS